MRSGKCEAYEPGCPNWDTTYNAPKYPKSKRVSVPLYPLRFKSGSFILMCADCRRNRLAKYPELEEFQGKWKAVSTEVNPEEA